MLSRFSRATTRYVFLGFSIWVAVAALGLAVPAASAAVEGAPAGLKAMERPELLPLFLPTGTETRQFISYDPSGSNNDGNFANSFTKYIDSNGEFVIFDAVGPGCLYRQQMNIWFSDVKSKLGEQSRIRYYFDDEPTPRIDKTVDEFFGGKSAPFDAPFGFMDLGETYKRFAILYYPFAFQKRLKVTTTLNLAQNGAYPAAWQQYTYLAYPDATNVRTWTGSTEDSPIVRNQWNNLGVDPKPAEGNLSVTKTLAIKNGETANVLNLSGQGSIASLRIAIAPYNKETFFNTHIKIYWDGAAEPAVDLPLGHFFGGGGKDFPCGNDVWQKTLKTLFFGFDKASGTFYAYWPMPYWSSAKIDIVNQSGQDIASLKCDVDYKPAEALNYAAGQAGHFYAKRTVDRDPGGGSFVNVFEERGKGHLVGLSFYTDGFAMDGDEFTYIDGNRTAQMHGDGTEDDHNQGWGGADYQKPLWGGLLNGYQGAYRIYMNDAYVFNKHIKINYEFSREGGDANGGKSDVVVYYYKSPSLDGLALSDQLDVGNPASEKKHRYTVVGQTWEGALTSCYDGYERDYEYDRCTDDGRAFNGASQFTVKIDPANNGVKLRRRLHRSGNGQQRADVFVDCVQVAERPWDVCTLSAAPYYQSWFDADFEIPAAYTRGKSSIEVKVQYRSSANKTDMNEHYYWVFSHVDKPVDRTPPGPATQLAAVAVSSGQVNLIWNAPTDASGVNFYQVYRSEKSDFAGAVVIGRPNATSLCDTRAKPGIAYCYKVSAVDSANHESVLSAPASATSPAASAAAAASFLGRDATTSGAWAGVYGGDGFLMPKYFHGRDCAVLPEYVSGVDYGTLSSHQFSLWFNPTGASLKTTPISHCGPYLGCVWTAANDTMTVHVNDAKPHRLALYVCDFDKFAGGRNQDVEILDLHDNVLAPAQNVADFQNGVWLNYRFSGSIKIRLTNRNPQGNAVLSALMFDADKPADPKKP